MQVNYYYVFILVIILTMDQMSTLKQSSPLWPESICMFMATWTMTASMKVR